MKQFIFINLLLAASHVSLPGQSLPEFFEEPAFSSDLVCVWAKAGLRDLPGDGSEARYVTTVYFGESVTHLGEEAYVKSEDRTYIKVRNINGEVGWVNDFLFVNNGTLAVVLDDARIYLRPRTVSTVTDQVFAKGEVVVLVSFSGEWAQVIGKNKQKQGWIKGLDKVSDTLEDVELAVLLDNALQQKDDEQRRIKLSAMAGEAAKAHPILQSMYQDQARIYGARPQVASTGVRGGLGARTTQAQSPSNAPSSETGMSLRDLDERPSLPTPQIQRKIGRDPVTGVEQEFVIEQGGIYQVRTPNNIDNLFFAYHKSLPIGSKIKLQIPDNKGFVVLEVIGKLGEARTQVVGLSQACIDAVYGPDQPLVATIEYLAQ